MTNALTSTRRKARSHRHLAGFAALAVLAPTCLAGALAGGTVVAGPAAAATPPRTIFVANYGWVTSYPLPSPGNVKPKTNMSITPGGVTSRFVAFDAKGDLWETTGDYGAIFEFTPTQLASSTPQKPHVTLNSLTDPGGLAFDGAGDLWVTTQTTTTTTATLREFTPTQLAQSGVSSPTPKVTITANKSTTTWSMAGPEQIAFDRSGNLWVANDGLDALTQFTPSQLASSGDPEPAVTIRPSSPPVLEGPFALTFNAAGDLWVGNNTSQDIVQYTPSQLQSTGKPTPAIILTTQPNPEQFAMDQYGNLWDVSNFGGSTLNGYAPQLLTLSGKPTPSYVTKGATTQLQDPSGVALETAPTLSSVTPSSTRSGAMVTLHGLNFTSSTTVSFGGVQAATVIVVSPSTITAKVPNGNGTVTVTVATWAGTSDAVPFTYPPTGYDLVGSDGGVFVFDAPGQSGGFFGSLPGIHVVPVAPVVGLVPTLTDEGYFLVGTDGGVFAFGTAPFLGSLPGKGVTPAAPITGIVAADTDKGYFLVGKDGGVFAFGTVPFLGSLPGKGISVNNVIGIASTPSGNGYWVVSATGTVYGFGSAQHLGTAKGTSSPVAAIAGTPTGGGYWITTQNGGVYNFGNANRFGTLPAIHVTPALPVIGIVHTEGTGGYWLIGQDGGIFAFGDAGFVGSLPGLGVQVTNIVGAVPN